MKFTSVNSILFLLLILSFSSACQRESGFAHDGINPPIKSSNQIADVNNENTNSAKDDIDELGKIIRLPFPPEEAVYWEENFAKTDGDSAKSAQTGKKIVVVLKFSPEIAAQLISQIEKIKPATDSEIDAESRFPAELIAQSQLSGDETLKGKSYAADDFFQTPYTNGKITRIENSDYFVLELTTS